MEKISAVIEDSGYPCENLRSSILYTILPINMAIDSRENICGRVNNRKNRKCFSLSKILFYIVDLNYRF